MQMNGQHFSYFVLAKSPAEILARRPTMPNVVILVFVSTSWQVPAQLYTASSHQIVPSQCSLSYHSTVNNLS